MKVLVKSQVEQGDIEGIHHVCIVIVFIEGHCHLAYSENCYSKQVVTGYLKLSIEIVEHVIVKLNETVILHSSVIRKLGKTLSVVTHASV